MSTYLILRGSRKGDSEIKKLIFLLVWLVFSVDSFAQPFVPQTLYLNPNLAREDLLYRYSDGYANIPVEVQGNACRAVLFIYTHNKGEEIGFVRNGHLGWHWVNKIDTCIYVSPPEDLEPGANNLVWDLTNKDGHKIPEPEPFNYYLFAYEHETPKVPVMNRGLSGTLGNVYQWTFFEMRKEGGEMRDAPMITMRSSRWVVGGDPSDATNLRTTSMNQAQMGGFDMHDQSYFYQTFNHPDTNSKHVRRYQFVENGESIQDMNWGIGDGVVKGFTPIWEGMWGVSGSTYRAGTATDMDYIYTGGNIRGAFVNYFHVLNYEGEVVQVFDMSHVYIPDPDPPEGNGVFRSGGPNQIRVFNEFSRTRLNLNHHGWCWRVVVDPVRGIDNPDDFIVWINGNGDWFTDNFNPEVMEDPVYQWVCNTVHSPPWTYQMTSDANGVGVIHTYGIGLPTFGLFGPDGTGAGYHALYDEHSERLKYATHFVKYNTQWDGLYTDGNSTHPPKQENPDWAENRTDGVWYTPADSFRGFLVPQTSVEEKIPHGFCVAQNTPNPFNPSTDISFTIPERGHVSVEIFNIAGQRIEILKNEIMNPGTHTVKWDAGSHAGGVYFYTVTAGKSSRTMRMTLVK